MLITSEDMAALLGRSLTALETANYDLYLKIAIERLEDLLCLSICTDCDEGERTYESREGYRTLYVDPFTDINTVTVDGNETEDYIVKQNERFYGSWYNIIEFDRKQNYDRVVVDATWGFDKIPDDLKLLLAKVFSQGSVEQTVDNTVKSKEIEDFKVTYKDGATFDEFVLSNKATIDKYSQCNQGAIRHGRIRSIYYY